MRLLLIAVLCLSVLAPMSEAGLFRKSKPPKPKAKYGVTRHQQYKRSQKARDMQMKNREKARHRHVTKAPKLRPKLSSTSTE